MLKHHYERYDPFWRRGWGYFVKHSYYRHVRTRQEIARRFHEEDDLRESEYYWKIRLKRNRKTLDSWNDFGISRCGKRSWKDYKKQRKQWDR